MEMKWNDSDKQFFYFRLEEQALWHEEFKKSRAHISSNLHVLHPALRQSLAICKEHLNTITLAKCDCYK